MPYTRAWDETAPAGNTTPANTLDTVLQNLKVDLRERLNVVFQDFSLDPVTIKSPLTINVANVTTLNVSGVSVFTGAVGTGIINVSGLITTTDNLRFNAVTPKIIGGSTSLTFRNNADTSNNLLLWDTGLITTRGYVGTGVLSDGAIVIADGGVAGGGLYLQYYNGVGYTTFPALQVNTTYPALRVGFGSAMICQLVSLANASLPAANAALAGSIAVDNTNHRLVYYSSNGLRYYIPIGTSF